MTKWQLKPRVKKRTHYGKYVIGFSCFFIFLFIILTKKKNTLCKMKKKNAKLMHENMQ